MSSMLQFALDNSVRFYPRVHYFAYGGFRFKLIQNDPQRWSDIILTVFHEPPAEDVIQQAYRAAAEFVSALTWQLDFPMGIRPAGMLTVGARITLRSAQPNVFTFPEISFRGHHLGFELSRIAKIETEEQRVAVTLYREAQSSNKLMLSLLLNWQVMEVRTGKAVPWINHTMANPPNRLGDLPELLGRLGVKPERLGDYLLDDWRHAIAHIRRRPGKHALKFDDRSEAQRLHGASEIVRKLARHYIIDELGLTESCYLVRRGERGFPAYLDNAAIRSGPHTLVRRRSPGLFPKLRYTGPGGRRR